MYKFNRVYNCPLKCGKQFVIVAGHGFGTYLPIEVITGQEINDTVYSKEKGHVSHLKNCKGLPQLWYDLRPKLDKQLNPKLKIK